MYSFVDQIRHHWRSLLLVFAAIAACAVVCQAQDASSFSLSVSSGEPLLPCVYRGIPYLHGEEWEVDECTTCNCDNATTTCVIESCQPAFCTEPIKPDGECCYLCPFNVKVKKVTPQITSTGSISEGRENRLQLTVPIKFHEQQDTTGVQGEGLWRLSAWASPNLDGSGERFGYQRQVLSENQQTQHYKKKDSFRFQGVDFRLTSAQCSDLLYICTRLDRGDSPKTKGNLDYEFSGHPDESALTGCTGAPECKGVQARGLEWRYSGSNIIAGIENELEITATVQFTSTSADVTGNNLWRLGLYGSKNADGSGEKFNYNTQTLNDAEVSSSLLNAGPLEFTEARAMFDVAAIGCGPFTYSCMEFTKNVDASPSFSFSVLPEGDTITLCQQSNCNAVLTITNVADTVLSGTVIDSRASNPFSMDVRVSGAGIGVAGQGLWRMRAFGSSNADGSGQRFSERAQVLTSAQQDQTLLVTQENLYSSVNFDLDMRGLSCAEVQYVCVEFAKGDSPSTVFTMQALPDDSVLTSCSPAECEGVQARGLEWRYTGSDIIAGIENELDITATVQFTSTSADVTGSTLWRLGLYGSKNADGSGEKFNYNTQTLNDVEVSTNLRNTGPLEFLEAKAMYDVAAIGCGPFTYSCMEFTKNVDASPDFVFSVLPEGDTITLCQESPCRAALQIVNVADTVLSGGIVDGRSSNPYSMDVSVRGSGIGIAGQGLWKMRAFGSSSADGSGQRFSEKAQVLTSAQQDQTFLVTQDNLYASVNFDLDMRGLTCTQVQYVCVEFAKGDRPTTVFTLTPVPDPSVLVSCSPANCEGVQARGLEWRYTGSDIIAGIENELDITATVQFTSTSADVTGSTLWRLGLYGSKNADGSGEKFNYNTQTLNDVEVSTNLRNTGPLEFLEAKAMYDVAAIGCGPFTYSCMEFTKNVDASPDFPFSVLPEGDTITLCQESPCRADLRITNVDNRVLSGGILNDRYSNPYSMEVSVRGQGIGVAGEGLWAMRAFGSSTPDGSGQRFSQRAQVLTAAQQGQTILVTEDMLFASVDFDLNMQGLTCNQVQYVCIEFAKGANPTTVFNLIPVPDSSVLVSCSPADCEGVFAESLDWTLEAVEPVYPGEETSVSLDSTVGFRAGNRELIGSGLWRQGIFGSRSRDGSGERFNYKSQVFSRPQASTTLEADSSLVITDALVDFEIGTVGCNDYGYLCVEFTGGDNPNPDFFFRVAGATDNSRQSNTLVSCREQECLSKAIFTGLNVDMGNQLIYENKRNPLSVSLTGVTHADATNVRGTNLWQVAVYGSRRPDGSGVKSAYTEQILDISEASTTLNDGDNLPLDDVAFGFDLSGVRCIDAQYVCYDLNKNARASVNYLFEARPDESVLTQCVDMRDRCKGATAISVDWSYNVGEAPFGQASPLTLTADVNFDAESPDVNGMGLWQLGVYAARNPDGAGPRRDEITQTLDPFNQAKPLELGGPLEFDNIVTNFPIDDLGCDDYRYLCVEFKQGSNPSPYFKFETQGAGETIISCQEQACRGVEVDGLTSSPTGTLSDLILYEGKASNPIQYNSEATTTPDSGVIRGVDLWFLSQWGSERANGNGPQQNYQEQVLSGYHAALPVTTAGDTLDFAPLSTNFDMTGLRCPQVRYICNELSKNPRSRPDFQFTAVPNESVLRSCFAVPDGACKGVVFTDLDWSMETGTVYTNKPDDLRFTVDVTTLTESGTASGDGLWRIGVFGATNPQGTGSRLDYKRQILTRSQSSTTAEGGGLPLELRQLETEFDLTQLGCTSEYRYLCLEFAKGLRASPDFEFEINGGGDVIISCQEQPCRKSVLINDVETGLLGHGRVNEGTRNNRILYDMTAVVDRSSGGAQGKNLWELTTFGSTFPDGRGSRYNPRSQYTFSQYQKDKSAYPGENIRYGAVDTNFDMTGLTCNEVRYFCSELRKGSYATPDFEMIANPSEEVLIDCFELNCEGVLIDNTRLTGDDFELTDGSNTLYFDFTVNSNPTGGDVNGNNLWRLETFTATSSDGSGRRDILRTQTLDGADASRDLNGGNTLVFRNLEALVDSADVNCNEDYYLCAELSKHTGSSTDFTMRATREDALTSCRLIRCAKAQPIQERGRPGPKGIKGEPFYIPPGMVGPPGRPGLAGPAGYTGRRGIDGPSGPAGNKGEDGRDGNSGRRGAPGRPGPPGPPGEVVAAANVQSKGPAFTYPYMRSTLPGRSGSPGYSGNRGSRGPQGLRGTPGPPGLSGPPGPAGGRGPRGEDGVDGNDGRDGTPGEVGLAGEAGRAGMNGMPGMHGAQGHKGWNGRIGRAGARGDKGFDGETGGDGPGGPSGAPGNPGPRGMSGARGASGPQGPTGERGSTGQTGEQGPSGNSGPLGAPGAPGLVGAKGDSGLAGSQGSTGPSGLVGEVGARGSPGSAGPSGVPGSSGSDGGIGDAGIQGESGAPGLNGAPGAQGTTGTTGIAGERGNSGLPGYDGSPGNRGAPGPRGLRGPGGEGGNTGDQGPEGEQGSSGPAGPRGPSGETGPQGGPGLIGGLGLQGFMGDMGETGSRGAPGDTGDRGSNGEPGTPGNSGPNGAAGEDGLAGSDGKTGPTGSAGKDGPAGQTGERGSTGAPGTQGPPGIQGENGFNGNTGQTGVPGPRGDSGEPGDAGPAGPIGRAGAPGSRGDSGIQGPSGPPGQQGPSGQLGSAGHRGARGERGPNGPVGPLGLQGDVGENGLRGATGLQGLSGVSGERGLDGRAGRNGEVGPTGPGGAPGPFGLRGLQGPPGLRGGVGANGEMGEQGDRGSSGPSGPNGPAGDRGGPGPVGPIGILGVRGDNGQPGDPGTNGNPGSKGQRGAPGEKGRSGPRGVPGNPGVGGAPGERGSGGPQGAKGEAGPPGGQGRVGRTGPVGISGPRGSRGDIGNQGAPGPQGSVGINGPPGAVGEPGPGGPTGSTGPNGEPGQVGLRGHTGAPGLRGPPGPLGLQGPPGSSGEDGRTGPQGPRGVSGPQGAPADRGAFGGMGLLGPPGPAGPQGRPGPDGSTGPDGPNGERGSQGSRGPQGAVGPRGIPGSDGRDGKDGATGGVGPVGSRGDAGPKGQDGSPGLFGLRGAPGPVGPSGERGLRGKAGAQGPVGEVGEYGSTGPTGPSGPAGPRGETGPAGPQGHKGNGGQPGFPGLQGLQGESGPQGENGADGIRGINGLSGDGGKNGKEGPRGPPGLRGNNGERGERGSNGPHGPPGPPGPPGPAGATYSSGYAYQPPAQQQSKGPSAYSYYYRDEVPTTVEDLDRTKFEEYLNKFASEVQSLVAPLGSRDQPIRSCKDLFKCFPDAPDGDYWIDSNEGSVKDAYVAQCIKHGEDGFPETCITPRMDSITPGPWYMGPSGHRYVSSMNGLDKFSYEASEVQLTFLRLLSTKAHQNVTYHCKNSVAVRSGASGTTDQALKLLTTSDVELSLDAPSLEQYEVIEDGCQYHTGEWGQTVINFSTRRNTRLPIVDVAPSDIGREDQQFGVTLGPVCFS